MKPLIVGVDPGSTSAVAAVNLEGKVELLESGKNFPPREMIQRMIKVGKPVVVASDKGETPDKVEKLARSVGAKIFEPENDLSSSKKKELGKGANSHELDAVASAVNAQNQLQRDIKKINEFDEDLDVSKEKIALKVFKDQPIPEEKEEKIDSSEESEDSTMDDNSEGSQDNPDPRMRNRLQRKISNLEEQVEDLKEELENSRSENDRLRRKIDELKEEDRREVVKDREISKREGIIKEKIREIERLKEEIEEYRIRESQYRKAIHSIFEEDADPIPLIREEFNFIPEKAVTPDKEILEKLEKRGSEIHHLDEIDGIELRDYMVVDSLPDKTDFESIIKEYQDER